MPSERSPLLESQHSNELPSSPSHLSRRPCFERLWKIIINYFAFAWISIGPQTYLALLFDLYITRNHWLSEQTFAEIFTITNAIPGPAGTKLAFALALVTSGVVCAVLSFIVWSGPGGLVMFFVGYGIGSVGEGGLPLWFSFVQNGLSSVAVALVAVAAYRMGCKVLTDNTGRILAVLTAAAVMNFKTVVWIIPVSMVVGGVVTSLQESLPRICGWGWRGTATEQIASVNDEPTASSHAPTSSSSAPPATESVQIEVEDGTNLKTTTIDHVEVTYSLTTGLACLAVTFLLFFLSIALNSIPDLPRPISIVSTLYFVGMIIFGGGPVLVPLMYSYVVTNGWVSDSEFLFGLAFINAMPGPNYNFAAYCGALALRGTFASSLLGAFLAWLAINLSGLLIQAGILPIWTRYRNLDNVKVAFKGFSSVAVGLVFAATYILVEKAIVKGERGSSLLAYPHYVAVTGVAFVGVEFLKVPAPVVVLLGGFIGFMFFVAD
ncbi:hypothetical protein HDU97_009956 [Phlyctochytrium planicorne]|nr:hypothetical protein HDU97_009956 [Phlyctochytrium planicorne]